MHPLSSPSSGPLRRLAVTALVVPLLAVGACTAEEGGEASAPAETPSVTPTASTEQKPPRLRLDHRITRVAGELRRKDRSRLERRLGRVVRSYLDPAFVRAYPMDGPGAAFSQFTPGARKQARRDERLLTGMGLRRVDAVRVRRASAYYSVVAPSGRAVGATARLVVTLRATRDERTRPVRYEGRLLLTPTGKGWRVFGYDMDRSGLDALRPRGPKRDEKGAKRPGAKSDGRDGADESGGDDR